jgi:PmbA protein
MTDTTLEKIIDLAKSQGLQAEVYYQFSQDTPIEFENNRLKSLQTKATRGVALRVIADGRLGFASSTDLDRLEDLVTAARETAAIGDPVEFEFAKDVQLTSPESNYTPPSTAELVKIGENLIDRVREYNLDILVDVGFHVRSGKVRLATTDNVYVERNSKITSASLSGNLVRGEDFLQAYSYDLARDGEPDYDLILQKLLEKYRRAENTVTINSGSFPVLFTPRSATSTIGNLFDTILSGQSVVQKASPLADKLGEKLFDDRLTLYEDPSIGASACAFDDEGTPTSYKVLIDKGVVKQFYWDRRWAARAGCQSTGNGFRGGLSRPSPDLVNLCANPGTTSVEDLIAGMEEGVIVEQVLGAGQSNQLAGEFSVNLDLGYKVEKGEIVGRLKNTMVAGNIFDAFNNLVDFSDKQEWVGGGAYVPYVLFDRLGVASKN